MPVKRGDRGTLPRHWQAARWQTALGYIAKIVDACGGDVTHAAQVLGIANSTMLAKQTRGLVYLRRHGLQGAQYRARRPRQPTGPIHTNTLRRAVPFRVFMAQWEIQTIDRAIKICGSQTAAARWMGMKLYANSCTPFRDMRPTALRVLAAHHTARPVRQPKQGLRHWLRVLGIKVNGAAVRSAATFQQARTAFRKKMLACHPDRGGTHEAAAALNLVWTKIENSFIHLRHKEAACYDS